MSALGQKQTFSPLLDHLIGKREQRGRYSEPKRSRGLLVDDEFKLARLHNREVRRLIPIENAADVDAHLAIRICDVGPVAHQPTGFGILAAHLDRWDPVPPCRESQLDAPGIQEWSAS